MEWVHTTAESVEAAKDRALDELGVDEQDAEFEVLEEPRTGLFGRVRGEAKVKARVRPTQPRAKNDRRDRGRGKGRGRGRGGNKGGSNGGKKGNTDRNGGGNNRGGDRGGQGRQRSGGGSSDAGAATGSGGQRGGRGKDDAGSSKGGRGRQGNEASKKQQPSGADKGGRTDNNKQSRKEATVSEDVAIEEQGEIVAGFLEGLLDAFGADGEVHQEQVEDTTVELRVEGDDLGLLIGPRGATLNAVHEMCRTVLQREVAGGARARLRLDIGGYRERRRAALADFARTQAEGVLEDQTQRALEPMGAADRKVIHDTVNDIDGVRTISEGEDPKRRVVIVPEDD